MRGFGISTTSPKTPELFERRANNTAQKETKKAERTIVLKKNQKVPRITPDTLSQRVTGVTKKSTSADHFANHSSVPLLSTSQFQKKETRVISGETNVIS